MRGFGSWCSPSDDEAGLLSTHHLERLTFIAQQRHTRLLLAGDTKQHYSVVVYDSVCAYIHRASGLI